MRAELTREAAGINSGRDERTTQTAARPCKMNTASIINVPAEREMSLFKTVPPNVVQSIRAFRVTDLQAEAAELGQHFLYAYCAEATTKQQVLAMIAEAFHFPKHFGKNFDAL